MIDNDKIKNDFFNKFVGSTSPQEIKKYTGNSVLGIGTMHKSNGVPVFSKDEAKDIAGMRR